MAKSYTCQFKEAVDRVFQFEGDFVDHPDDPGGATNMGISLRFLKAHPEGDIDGDGDIDRDDIIALTTEDAEKMYHTLWLRYKWCNLDSIKLTTKLFELTVLMGGSRASKLMQQACNQFGADLKIDGKVGPITRKWINDYRWQGALELSLRGEAYCFVSGLGKPMFMAGWTKRLMT